MSTQWPEYQINSKKKKMCTSKIEVQDKPSWTKECKKQESDSKHRDISSVTQE